MAVIRRKNLRKVNSSTNLDLIDSVDKLLEFAKKEQVQIYPLDVVNLANKLEIKVINKDLGGDISGTLYKDESNHWVIEVNSRHHENRQRYSIAHEIAHWCLDRFYKDKFEDDVFFRGADVTKEEYRANEFASLILMPKDKIIDQIQAGIKDIDVLAKAFKVSTIALRVRLKKLGMIK